MAKIGKPLTVLAGVVDGAVVRLGEPADPKISDVTHDSRQVRDGWMFVALKGANFDGHDFAGSAAASGAVALCVEHELELPVAQMVVADTRRALGPLASAVHDDPSRQLTVLGVTGTNGKTTVTHYIDSLATSAGMKTGLIGTIHTKIGFDRVESAHTTPEASDFQRLLAQMREADVTFVAAEVSSHALELGRVSGTDFAVAAFTNLSQDHLDFHPDMTAYFAAKRRLFEDYRVGTAVINVDDEAGAAIARSFGGRLLTVGETGEIRHSSVRESRASTTFRIHTPWGNAEVNAPIVGPFNLDNALLAAGCALAADMSLEEVISGLGRLAGVPGRFEVVSDDDPVTVIVDYAHTPTGVEEAIAAARELTGGRVIALVGAGGDRDKDKRPLMGEALSSADLAIITSDNPRTEDPGDIATSVASGVRSGTESIVEIDRARAISRGISAAREGDVVLVLGRGHEPIQDLGASQVPFDDREVARSALSLLRGRGETGSQET